MQELTQEEAERCARACRAKWHNPPCSGWELNDHFRWLCSYKDVTPEFFDPRFWFPRLFERLNEFPKSMGLMFGAGVTPEINEISFHECDELIAEAPHPCLALCAAIEALEGK